MNLTPVALQEQINSISEDYFKLSTELAEIAERKGTEWLKIRSGTKTNAEADQEWDSKPDGRREAYLKIYLKGLEKLRGARILEWKSNNGSL